MFLSMPVTNEICGCYFVQGGIRQRQYLPQTKLHSYTRITPVCFSTQLEQRFSNSSDTIISELRYVFPLYDGVSVGCYTVRYGDQELKGIVKQKAAARKTYQAAVDRGETASLLESLPSGIFGITLGNIPPRTDIYVSVGYLGELKHDAGVDGLRYNLPTSIAPRYGSYPAPILHTPTIVEDGISITVDIDMGKSAIRRIQSPSHPIAVTMGNLSTEAASNAFAPSKGFAQLTQGHTDLGSDFILQIVVDDISRPQALVETHATLNSRAIMATFVPRFNLPLSRPEIVFIADQSGSMQGSKNEELKAALQVFLRSLPFGVRFNVCAFGSQYRYLFAKSQPYDEENLQTALKFVDTFQAQYGGTEIQEPVRQAFLRRLGDLPMEIMLLTDGEVAQEQELFGMIHQSLFVDGIDARVFALGIGQDVSHTLVEGVARAGNGLAQFISKNEETDSKILRMLRASLFPHTKDYSLEINFDDHEEAIDDFEIIEKVTNELHIKDDVDRQQHTKEASSISLYDESVDLDIEIQSSDRYSGLPELIEPKIILAPSRMPPLFPFNRANLYFLLGPEAPGKSVKSVTLRATAPSGPLELIIPITGVENGTVVNQLAARKAIQELENGSGYIQEAKTLDGEPVRQKFASRLSDLVEREAVRLGERYQVANKWCSFVAVDTKKDDPHTEIHQTTIATAEDHSAAWQPQAMARNRLMAMGGAPRQPAPGSLSSAQYNVSAPASLAMARQPFGAVPQTALRSQQAQQQAQQQQVQPAWGNTGFGAAPVSRKKRSGGSGLFSFGRTPANMPPSGAMFNPSGEEMKEEEDDDMSFGISFGRQVVACRTFPASITAKSAGQAYAVPESKAAITAESPPASGLRAIINDQLFAGYWVWDQYLLDLLHLSKRSIGNLDQDEKSATALVLMYLETKMNAHRDVWELVAEKARNWLQDQMPSTDSLQALLTRAKEIVVY